MYQNLSSSSWCLNNFTVNTKTLNAIFSLSLSHSFCLLPSICLCFMICRCFLKDFIASFLILIQPVRLQFVRHGPHVKGEEKVWQKECRISSKARSGNDEKNGEHDKLWSKDNIDMKVYNDRMVPSTTSVHSHSKCDHQITSLVTIAPSHPTAFTPGERNGNENSNNNNSINKLCDDSTNTNNMISNNGNDKLITWTWYRRIKAGFSNRLSNTIMMAANEKFLRHSIYFDSLSKLNETFQIVLYIANTLCSVEDWKTEKKSFSVRKNFNVKVASKQTQFGNNLLLTVKFVQNS